MGVMAVLSSKATADTLTVSAQIIGQPPTQPAQITSPADGTTVTANPVTVVGSCEIANPQHTIKIFSNDQFIGSGLCSPGGAFSIPVDLFEGSNILKARTFTFQDQEGPPSTSVTVIFKPGQITTKPPTRKPAEIPATDSIDRLRIVMKTQYLSFTKDKPFTITFSVIGGKSPYAVGIEWGEKGKHKLLTVENSQEISLSHTYKQNGPHTIRIEAVDQNDNQALFELGFTNGLPVVTPTATSSGRPTIFHTDLMLLITYVATAAIVLGFWVGERWEWRRVMSKQR